MSAHDWPPDLSHVNRDGRVYIANPRHRMLCDTFALPSHVRPGVPAVSKQTRAGYYLPWEAVFGSLAWRTLRYSDTRLAEFRTRLAVLRSDPRAQGALVALVRCGASAQDAWEALCSLTA